MEFSAEVLDGLQTAGDSVHIPDNLFPTVVSHCCACLLTDRRSRSTLSDLPLTGVDAAVVKQAHAAVATLLLEAAKHDADAAAIGSILEDCKHDTDRISAFTKVYNENKQNLRILLSSIGMRFPHVVDVDWRLDYYIKNNFAEKINELVYIVNLKTEEVNNDEIQDVQFSCTQDQLQDLVGKLKDACKSLERASQH